MKKKLPEPEIIEKGALELAQQVGDDLCLELGKSSFVATLAKEAKDHEESLAAMQDFEVKSQDDFSFGEEALADTQRAWKDYEKRRTEFTKPANHILKTFNGWFKPAQDPLKKIEALLKSKLSQYRMDQIREQQKLIEEARQVEEPEEIRGALIAAANAVPAASTTTYIDRWVFAVTDVDKIPRQFMCPDEKKIGQVVAALRDKTDIPGIRAWNDPIVRGKT